MSCKRFPPVSRHRPRLASRALADPVTMISALVKGLTVSPAAFGKRSNATRCGKQLRGASKPRSMSLLLMPDASLQMGLDRSHTAYERELAVASSSGARARSPLFGLRHDQTRPSLARSLQLCSRSINISITTLEHGANSSRRSPDSVPTFFAATAGSRCEPPEWRRVTSKCHDHFAKGFV